MRNLYRNGPNLPLVLFIHKLDYGIFTINLASEQLVFLSLFMQLYSCSLGIKMGKMPAVSMIQPARRLESCANFT